MIEAKAILERMSQATQRVHDAATGLIGTLCVGYVRGYERSDLSELMRRFHQEHGNILFRASDCESILMMVAAEEGISILPDYCTEKLYHADNLQFVPLEGQQEYEEIIAAWRGDNVNPALSLFLQEVGY